MKHVSLQRDGDGVAVLWLDNVDGGANLVTPDWIEEMSAAIAELAADVSIGGVVIASKKANFMAGADLHYLLGAYETFSRRDAFQFSQHATAMHRAIEKSGKPWVAALTGWTLGGGFELALACHGRVISDSPNTRVGLPEVTVGLLPGSGGTQRLARMIGARGALDLLLSGRSVLADEALKLGLVDEVAPTARLVEIAKSRVTGLNPVRPWDVKGYAPPEVRGLLSPDVATLFTTTTAALAKRGYNDPAPAAIASSVFEGLQLPFDKALAIESKYFATLLTSPVARNIIRTTFVSKQAAERGARRPVGYERQAVARVGVIGAGMMGAGIAHVAAVSGAQVVLIDRDLPSAEKGKAHAAKLLAKEVAKGRRTQGDATTVLSRIEPSLDYAGLHGCDLIVEAVFEDPLLKGEIIRRVERSVSPDTVLASNTSTLPITELGKASARAERFIGLHFFSPVDRMGLVEIIRGAKTEDFALARALDFVMQLKKTPIVVNDGRGFYTSRVFQTFIHEGAAMLGEGVPPAAIENIARSVGMPMGPLALLDEVTLDLPLKIVDEAIAADRQRYVPPAGVKTMRKMRDELGRSGRKAGGGFYDYFEGGKRLWSGLAEHFPIVSGYDVADLGRRILYVQAIESARCLEEGVLEMPADGDLGAVFGWSFPAWTGGTLSYIDTLGAGAFVAEADRLAETYGARFAPSAWLRKHASEGRSFYRADGAGACAA